MPNGLKELESILKKNVDNDEHCVFLHPEESRGYTDDELTALKHRDFETRLFITGTQCAGDSVFLRTHHTDNAQHTSNLNYVRDYLKAFHVIENWTCAKSVLTTLLTMCFQLEPSDYYTFAISIASGLSRDGANTDFEAAKSSHTNTGTAKSDEIDVQKSIASGLSERSSKSVGFSERLSKNEGLSERSTQSLDFKSVMFPKMAETYTLDDSRDDFHENITEMAQRRKSKSQIMLVHQDDDHSLIRRKLCFLMDVVFKRLAIKKFLVDDQQSNIYRLVHCRTKYSTNKSPLAIALFAFILQVSLATYVALEFLMSYDKKYQLRMLPLAIFTAVHSAMITVANIHESMFAYRIFGRIGPLQMMDFIMSALIPIFLTVIGFFVIFTEVKYIEAVLNCTALLFIPEIDDQLPFILGLRTEEIVKNFLVAESITTFDAIARLKKVTDFSGTEMVRRNVTCGVQFSDFYITNLPEQGISDDTPFQPYQVIVDDNEMGHQIDPSSFVTSDCLVKRIEWKYSTGYPRTTKPRVAYLHLTKIDDTVVEIERKPDPLGIVGIHDISHSMEGMFIITTFQMSEDIIKLRICGSYDPQDFLKAFDCYSLWDVSQAARKAIMSLPKHRVKAHKYNCFEDV